MVVWQLALGAIRLMSALGHKRTCAAQNGMAALPPKSGHKSAVRDLSNLMSALLPKMSALSPIADIHPLTEDPRKGE